VARSKNVGGILELKYLEQKVSYNYSFQAIFQRENTKGNNNAPLVFFPLRISSFIKSQ
jgi:hypothetical protein